MSGRHNTLRLFVGLYPGATAAAALGALVDHTDLGPLHPTSPDQVHLTACFIGERPARDLPALEETVARSGAGVGRFSIQPLVLRTLPQRGHARTLVVETDRPPALLDIHERLIRRLARKPHPDARRRFLPHLTIARFRPPGAAAALEQEIDMAPFTVDEIRLVRSVLHPGGARHETVAVFPLDD